MKRRLPGLALLLALAAGPAAADNAGPEQQLRLAEQKLKLVEMLIDAPATRANAARQNGEGSALIAQSRELAAQARQAIAGRQFDAATVALDEALRQVFKLNSRPAADGSQAEAAQRQRFRDFAEQLAGYRASLRDMAKDPKNGEAASRLLGRIDRLSDDGRKLHEAGQLADANRKMAEAYKLAVAEISQLRAGQEVVLSLKFASPQEEFEYELKRYQSNEILVGMLLGDESVGSDRRRLVDGFVAEAARLRDEARQAARGNEHKAAVGTMEKANGQLNRALQSLGVPVF